MSEGTVIEEEFTLADPQMAVSLFGINDAYLKLIEEGKNVIVSSFGDHVKIKGSQDDVSETKEIFAQLAELLKKGVTISNADVVSAMTMAEKGTLEYFQDLYTDTLIRDRKGRSIRVKNYSQRQYVQAVKHNDLVFGIGPAGTGKTYLAVVMAVAALKRHEVERLVLTRPAVEAGESLGFLPGDLKEKVDPYLRPLYDALFDLLGFDKTQRLLERQTIENATRAQLKMFLTRLGFGSKMIVNGDKTQIDLPAGHKQSGLVDAEHVLSNLAHIGFVHFDAADVVRHPVVSEIISAYEKHNKTENED